MAELVSDDPNPDALHMLGASRLSRQGRATALELREVVRRGLPFSALESLARHSELSPQDLAAVVGIPARTFARRRQSRHLTPEESDRLYRVARAFALSVQVLTDVAKARTWLIAPNRALGGETPLALLDTDIGARQVEDVLQRLNYGIFS